MKFRYSRYDLTLYFIGMPIKPFANRADQDQELPDQGLLYLLINVNMIRYDPTL